MNHNIDELRHQLAWGDMLYAAVYLTPTSEQWKRLHNTLMLMAEPTDADLQAIEKEGNELAAKIVSNAYEG